MDFRKSNTPQSDQYHVFTHLTELTNFTLCPKEGQDFHNLKCVQRKCENCGVITIQLSEQETATEDSPDVDWMRYEYVSVQTKNGTRKKLSLVKKRTQPGIMFRYFIEILSKFSGHVFRSKWQADQLKCIKSKLPQNEAICIHDFSENCSCKDKIEIQSSYFQKTEVSIHVSIIYRHRIQELDGQSDSDAESDLIEEQFFVISPDQVHDHNFTHEVQRQISEYLQTINANVKTMHEFTDGCASQYKSRHCFGDLSFGKVDFGYEIIRNYF